MICEKVASDSGFKSVVFAGVLQFPPPVATGWSQLNMAEKVTKNVFPNSKHNDENHLFVR